MLKIGLTGSIGTGKSTILNMFKELGVKTWSADDAVHETYKKNGQGNKWLYEKFGEIRNENGDIDRDKLSKKIIDNPNIIKEIEKIIHPLVKNDRAEFIKTAKKNNEKYIILDIPLLFETKSQNEFDKIIVTNCDEITQKQRVLARKNMNIEKFEAILNKQIPNSEKVKLADFVIDTNQSIAQTKQEIEKLHQEFLKNA